MKKSVYNKWLDVIADYYSADYPSKDKALNAAVGDAIRAIPTPWGQRRASLKGYMIYNGAIESVKGGCYGISYDNAFNNLQKVYGDDFNEDVYVKKDGGWRYKNGEPYVWLVYCHQIAMALATYFKKEYTDKGKPFTD